MAIVLPSAPLYHQISSLLVGIKDTPFPEEPISAEIANALPEVAKLQMLMAERNEKVADLSQKSVILLQEWYEIVEGFNACVAEWDDRLTTLERKVRRREKVLKEGTEY
jgi:hypothetical protein